MVERAAMMSAPTIQVRDPMFIAAIPVPLELGKLVGGMLMSLRARGVSVESYISHGPTQRYVENLLGFDIPLARPERDGSLARAAGGRYTARHRDMVVSLHLLRKLKCGEALDENAFRELELQGRVRLLLLYYYRFQYFITLCPESFFTRKRKNVCGYRGRGRMRRVTLRELLGRELNDVERRYAPHELYVEGALELPLRDPRVAVVGTRQPSPAGRDAARLLAERLVEQGVAVVSGLARGIDTVAHTTAIGRGGRTIAVLGTPLDRFYPPENRDLQLRIMREHLAVSQFPPGHATRRWDFVARNRTMALISDATVIVEAGAVSGAISQGWEAIRLGRPLYIWRDTFDNSNLTWPGEMERYGARRLDEGSIDELLDELPVGPIDYTVKLWL
jgi:DNA processing protein